MTEEKILDICRENSDKSEKEKYMINMETEINTENGFDSLAVMNIIISIEDECGFDLDDYVIKISEAKYIKDILKIVNKAAGISVVDMTENEILCSEFEKQEKPSVYTEEFNADAEEKEYLCINTVKKEYYSYDEISYGGNIVRLKNGGVSFGRIAAILFEYFDMIFKDFAYLNYANEEKYPVLLSENTLVTTGYSKKYPGYSMHIEENDTVLSPSACFHVYEKYQDTVLDENTAITFLQNVFRNEQIEFEEFGRLKDYHVRETVFIGNEKYVNNAINSMINKTSAFIIELGLAGSIESAADLFITPKMQRYKLIQMHNKAKYEVRLNCDNDKKISVASFNRHGQAFSYPFNINISGQKNVVSGCVGYGIERWVMAFMSQYGCNVDNMPESVRKYVKNLHLTI